MHKGGKLMRKFDYSFLNDSLIPSYILNLIFKSYLSSLIVSIRGTIESVVTGTRPAYSIEMYE